TNICLPHDPLGDEFVYRPHFTLNQWDDLRGGYASYPVPLLGEGSLGEDPFNGRLSETALGGLSLLQTHALLFLPITYIHLIDPGIGILALPLVFYGMARRRQWPNWLAGGPTVFTLVLKTRWINASAMVIPSILLLSLFDTLEEMGHGKDFRYDRLLILAL